MTSAESNGADSIRLVRRAVGLIVLALLLAGCDGDGLEGAGTRTPSPSVALPTASATRSPIRTETPMPTEAPSPTATRTPIRSETPTPTEAPSPTATRTQPATPTTSEAPTPTRTVTATETETETASPTPTLSPSETPTPSPTESPTPSPSPSAQAASTEDDGSPAWLWWLLAAVAVALAVGIPLLARARRRQAWRSDLGAAESEVAWFARMLIPDLRRAGSAGQIAGGWGVAASRVGALEDRLIALEMSAPDDAGRARALALRDAVRASRVHLEELVRTGATDTLMRDLDAIAARLESALQVASAGG